MRKLKNYFRISFGDDIYPNLVISLALVFLMILVLIIMSFSKNQTNYIPKNMAYVTLKDNISTEEFLKELNENNIKYYKTIPLEFYDEEEVLYSNPFLSTTVINLEELEYSNEVSPTLLQGNQKKINAGDTLQKISIQYNFNNSIVNKKNINLPSEFYHIDSLIVGSYPYRDNEVLISETVANYYLQEKGLTNYNDLIGEKILIKTKCSKSICDSLSSEIASILNVEGTYIISGVYELTYPSGNNDAFIINPNNSLKEKYLEIEQKIPNSYYLEADNYKGLLPILENDYYLNEIDYKDLKNQFSYRIVFIFIVIFMNIILYFVYKKNIKKINYVLLYYGYSKIKVILINLIPFIVFNFISLILYIYI